MIEFFDLQNVPFEDNNRYITKLFDCLDRIVMVRGNGYHNMDFSVFGIQEVDAHRYIFHGTVYEIY